MTRAKAVFIQKPALSVDGLGSKWEDGAKAMVKVQGKALASV
jgi:hypothetical protein